MFIINKEESKINIGHLSTAYHTNFILMQEKKLAEDLNKKITWHQFGTGPAMVQAFQRNELDMGYMGLPPAIIAIEKGIPIKCVAGGHVEGTIMVAPQKYKTFSDFGQDLNRCFSQFEGSSIGVPSKGSIHDIILNFYLDKFELFEKIEVLNYGQAEFIAYDMQQGILGGGVGTPALAAFSYTILNSHIIIPPDCLRKNNPSYGIFFHQDMINNQPKVVRSFLKHHKRASIMLRNSPDEAAELITKSFPLMNKKYVKSVLEISPKYCIDLPEGYISSTMKFVDDLYVLNYIKKPLKENEIFLLDFVEEVHPERHHYL
ncbi:MAG: ABC transporter substrate-binding protein [Promethearchaeia archaeon]